MTITFDTNGTSTLDETADLQNSALPITADAGDLDDNDVAVADLPQSFSDLLFGNAAGQLDLSETFPTSIGVAESADDLVTVTSTSEQLTALALTDVNGDPLEGFETDLFTTDGHQIYLWTSADGTVVFGTTSATDAPGTPDGGDVVFAVYMETVVAGDGLSADLKFWTVTFEPLAHGDGADPDDPLDIFEDVYIGAEGAIDFTFDTLPSGQNLFGIVGDASAGLIVIGRDAEYKPNGTYTNTSDTINTSQGGGPTTIGIDNQMFDPGDGAYFTFVNSPEPSYLSGVTGGLDQNEADDADNIQYGSLLDVTGGYLKISQVQGSDPVSLKLEAINLTATDPQGKQFVDNLGVGTTVNISVVTITTAGGTEYTFTSDVTGVTVTDVNGIVVSTSATQTGTFDGLSVDFTGPTAIVSGIGAGYKVEWIADAAFNQVLVEGVTGKFDIGGFGATEGVSQSYSLADLLYVEDDAPTATLTLEPGVEIVVDESVGENAGEVGELTSLGSVTVSGATLFSVTSAFGSDGAATADATVYSLRLKTEDAESGLVDTATGAKVLLSTDLATGDIIGTVMEGAVEVEVIRISIDPDTGDTTVTLSRAVKHGDATDPDEADTPETIDSGLVYAVVTVTDGDDDPYSDDVDIGPIIKLEDDGPTVTIGDGDSTAPLDESTVEEGDDVGGSITLSGGADGVKSVSVNIVGDDPDEAQPLALTDGTSVSFDDPDGVKGTLTVSYTTLGGIAWSFEADADTSGGTGGGGSFDFSVTVTDGDDDTAPDTHKVTVADSTPLLSVDDSAVDEDGIVSGVERPAVGDDLVDDDDGTPDNDGSETEDRSEETATGTITVTDDDTPVTLAIVFTGAGPDGSLALTSGSAPVATVTVGSTIYFYTGSAPAADTPPASGAIVATLAWTGTSYTYTQVRPFDHPATNDPGTGAVETAFEDNLVLGFGVTATDALGNTQTASFTVNVDDDSPTVSVGNLVGTGTDTVQTGYFDFDAGSDQLESFVITKDQIMVGTLDVTDATTLTADTTGTGELAKYNVSITADFDGNALTDETITGVLTFKTDGSYTFDLDDTLGSSQTVSSADGQLTAGGPDPVRTLVIGDKEVVFTAVLLSASDADLAAVLGKTEEYIEQNLMNILSESKMNVSTAGIGLGNNNFNGNTTDGLLPEGTDESFIVDPQFDVTSMKVFIDNSVGGYDPATEDLYYRVYSEGSWSDWIKVEAGDLTAESGGQKSFEVVDPDGGTLIDGVQFAMGTGTVKIPVIDFITEIEIIVDDISMDLVATITDGDGDTETSNFTIDIVSDTDPTTPPDRLYTGVNSEVDAFNFDLSSNVVTWKVDNFESGTDKLVLEGVVDPNDVNVVTSDTGADVITYTVAGVVKTITIDNGSAEIDGTIGLGSTQDIVIA